MIALVAICFAGAMLAGCSLPGRSFPGGPSPWLPGGAPGAVYAPSVLTAPAPAKATHAKAAESLDRPDDSGKTRGDMGLLNS